MSEPLYDIYVDTGGTFTDCIGRDKSGQWHRRKVLSHSALRGMIEKWLDTRTLVVSDQWGLQSDIIRGYQFHLLKHRHEVIYVQSFDYEQSIIRLTRDLPDGLRHELLSFEITTNEEAPVLGARLITQTPVDLDLPVMNMKLGSTKGTNALLEKKGADLVLFTTSGFRDLLDIGTQQRPDIFALNVLKREMLYKEVIEVPERIDSDGHILRELEVRLLDRQLALLKRRGYVTAAISLMNSYANPVHEYELAAYLRKHGFTDISVSSDLSSMIKLIQRTETAVVNAYLNPVMKNYLANVRNSLSQGTIHVMTSAGSLLKTENFHAKDSLLSGPAGGVVGASALGRQSGNDQIISFDMGGTSTDVSRVDGDYDYRYDLAIGDARIFCPALAIETVAAGGGSVCYFDGYKLCVGPESAGATPGPAAYGANGPFTLTDVNLLLGRLDIQQFGIPVFIEEAEARLSELCRDITEKKGNKPEKEEVLTGFLSIANEVMAGAIKKISIAKGYDPADFAMVAFGGAGGMHACSIAEILGINKILVPEDAGLLSSYGLANARIERFSEQQLLAPLGTVEGNLPGLFEELSQTAIHQVRKEGIKDRVDIRLKLISLRFEGQDSCIDLPYLEEMDLAETFEFHYRRIYGHWTENRGIEVESIRVIASEAEPAVEEPGSTAAAYTPEPSHMIKSYTSHQWQPVPVYLRTSLEPGARIQGVAILLDSYSTTVIEKDWQLDLDQYHTAVLSRSASGNNEYEKVSSVEAEMELFTNRFMFIAENMGAMLQRTSLSVNVKERLDYSCALIDPEGRLVANAPHIPVHLGGLGVCVRELAGAVSFEPGDTVITNHPAYGGSHLPDITLVTPVFTRSEELLGYVVNRAHHAEIGGTRPASMPPDAKNLVEEGVVISPTYLLRKGTVRWKEIRRILEKAPHPTRAVEENIADLNAALAANKNGADSLRELAALYGTETIRRNMNLLREYAAEKMKNTLMNIADGVYLAEEQLDDGTPLKVRLTIKGEKCWIDFSGSGGLHPGNMNATQAIVNSVVIYVLRLLLDEEIPLNEGMMEPLELIIPEGMLNPVFDKDPSRCPAIVGGNVEVSQRLTDTLLKAFDVVACSQGTMNNVLIGNRSFSYYETICGGCGGGDGFNGASAVHHHMTNTRITDPEVLEKRYPLRIERFRIRKNSGGKGRYKGGDGVIREFSFLEPASISLLSQHRIQRPYGLNGGKPGRKGKQFIIRTDQGKERLQGIDGTEVMAGDRLVIKTPGGGGWGSKT